MKEGQEVERRVRRDFRCGLGCHQALAAVTVRSSQEGRRAEMLRVSLEILKEVNPYWSCVSFMIMRTEARTSRQKYKHTYFKFFHPFLDGGEVGRVGGVLALEHLFSFYNPGLQSFQTLGKGFKVNNSSLEPQKAINILVINWYFNKNLMKWQMDIETTFHSRIKLHFWEKLFLK